MQHVSCLVIISFILMTRIYDQLVITLGEIRCLSLLGLKGLMCSIIFHVYKPIKKRRIHHMLVFH